MKAVNLVTPEHEHEFEAATGLPEKLPAGETLLWQGGPDPLRLAREALHLDAIAAYFGLLLAWRGVTLLYDGATLWEALVATGRLLPLFTLALALLGLMAWLIARTSVYTITNRRVVMRVGVVLSITFNLPFAQITSAALRRRGGRAGDIVLGLGGEGRIAYLHLWPHARPWKVKQTQPMLRSLADADHVAQTLAHALSQSQAAMAHAAATTAEGSADARPWAGMPTHPAMPSRPAMLPPAQVA